jgi:ATP-binding cassette subfamily C protein
MKLWGDGSLVVLLGKAYRVLDREERRRWLVLVAYSLVATGLETIGAVAILAFGAVINGSDTLFKIPLVGPHLRSVEPAVLVVVTMAAVAVFFLLKNGFLFVQIREQERCATASTVKVSTRLFRRYLAAGYSFHLNKNSAELIRNVNYLPDVVYRISLLSAVRLLSEAMVIVAITAVLLVAEPQMTLATIATFGIISAIIVRLTQKRHRKWGEENQEYLRLGLLALQQGLGSAKEVKVLGREKYFLDLFDKHRSDRGRTQYLTATAIQLPRLALETMLICSVAIVVVVLQLRVGQVTGELFVTIGLFAYAGFRIMPSVNRIINSLNNIRYGTEAIETVWRDHSPILVIPGAKPESDETGPFSEFQDAIRLETVSFAFEGASAKVLDGVDLAIERNSLLGIAGPSGAGKTTLVDLILGLHKPTEGRITADGRDIADDPRGWRRLIGYVPQNFYLIDDTLRRNIAFGLTDAEIDEARVRKTVEMAQLADFVASLPEGLDTVVGERGVRLSGGQRQRIALARALYGQPPILVFDEATSALDPVTEEEINQEINRLAGDKTVIVIAHRLSSLMHCDRIVFMKDGRIAAQGTFQDLIAANPDFRRLVEAAQVTGGAI